MTQPRCHDGCPYSNLWNGVCKCCDIRTTEHRYHTTTRYPTNDSHVCRLCGTGFAGGKGIDAHLAIHLAEHALDQLPQRPQGRRHEDDEA